MGHEKSPLVMLVLKMLDKKDMYGYQIIEELAEKSSEMLRLKSGTLYPVLHSMENSGIITSYNQNAAGRMRKYYRITQQGSKALEHKKEEWNNYTKTINTILEGSANAWILKTT